MPRAADDSAGRVDVDQDHAAITDELQAIGIAASNSGPRYLRPHHRQHALLDLAQRADVAVTHRLAGARSSSCGARRASAAVQHFLTFPRPQAGLQARRRCRKARNSLSGSLLFARAAVDRRMQCRAALRSVHRRLTAVRGDPAEVHRPYALLTAAHHRTWPGLDGRRGRRATRPTSTYGRHGQRPILRRSRPGPGRGLAVPRSRPLRRPARPAGADRPQRRGQDDLAEVPRRPDRDRRGPAHDPAGHAGRAARAGPGHGRLRDACAISCSSGDGRAGARTRSRRSPTSSASTSAGPPRPPGAASGAARRSPARWRRSPTCCCSTSRPTISISAAIEWLEDWLDRFNGAFIVISHDRTFLTRLTQLRSGSTAARCAAPRSASAASRRGPSRSMPRKRARPRSSTPS